MFSFDNVVKHFTLNDLVKYKKTQWPPFCDWVVGPVAEVDRLVVESVSHQFDSQSQWLAGVGCSVAKIVSPMIKLPAARWVALVAELLFLLICV